MRLRLHRGDLRLGELLGESARHVVSASQLLAEVLVGEQGAREATSAASRELDQRSEEAALAVLRALSAAFLTPIDRTDLYRLTWALRLCVARVDAAIDEITLFRLGDLPVAASDLVQLAVRAADLSVDGVRRLRRPRTLSETWIELTRLAKQSGQTHRALVAELTLTVLDPAMAQRQIRVADSLQAVMTAFEAVAEHLQAIAVTEG